MGSTTILILLPTKMLLNSLPHKQSEQLAQDSRCGYLQHLSVTERLSGNHVAISKVEKQLLKQEESRLKEEKELSKLKRPLIVSVRLISVKVIWLVGLTML